MWLYVAGILCIYLYNNLRSCTTGTAPPAPPVPPTGGPGVPMPSVTELVNIFQVPIKEIITHQRQVGCITLMCVYSMCI